MMRLNIGCGRKEKWVEGFEGVDKINHGQKYVFDVEKSWPLTNNLIDEIYSSHCLEHIKNINYFMREMWRTMKPNAIATIIVPYYRWEGSFRDPSHCRFFTENTFNYFNKEYAGKVDYDMEYEYDFQIVNWEIINLRREIKCQLKAIKD